MATILALNLSNGKFLASVYRNPEFGDNEFVILENTKCWYFLKFERSEGDYFPDQAFLSLKDKDGNVLINESEFHFDAPVDDIMEGECFMDYTGIDPAFYIIVVKIISGDEETYYEFPYWIRTPMI